MLRISLDVSATLLTQLTNEAAFLEISLNEVCLRRLGATSILTPSTSSEKKPDEKVKYLPMPDDICYMLYQAALNCDKPSTVSDLFEMLSLFSWKRYSVNDRKKLGRQFSEYVKNSDQEGFKGVKEYGKTQQNSRLYVGWTKKAII